MVWGFREYCSGYLGRMGTMRHHLFLLLVFVGLGLHSVGQSPRFIELAVSDTLFLEPASITYQIQAGEDNSFMGMKMPFRSDGDSIPAASLDMTMAKLKAAKFNVERAVEKSYTLNKETRQARQLEVKLNSRAELDRLLGMLRSIEGISGSVKEVTHASPDQTKLYADLLDKARREAQAIAAASDLKLGPVLSVSEQRTEGYGDLMKQMMKAPPFSNMLGKRDGVSEEYVRTVLVRFEAN